MVINLKAFQDLLNFMYKDKANVKRMISVINPETGLTSSSYAEISQYENMECKLSYSSIDNATVPTDKADNNPNSMNPMLFYPLKYDIKRGDKITVSIIGDGGACIGTINAICGEPVVYQMFKQVELSVEDS